MQKILMRPYSIAEKELIEFCRGQDEIIALSYGNSPDDVAVKVYYLFVKGECNAVRTSAISRLEIELSKNDRGIVLAEWPSDDAPTSLGDYPFLGNLILVKTDETKKV